MISIRIDVEGLRCAEIDALLRRGAQRDIQAKLAEQKGGDAPVLFVVDRRRECAGPAIGRRRYRCCEFPAFPDLRVLRFSVSLEVCAFRTRGFEREVAADHARQPARYE